MKTEKQKEHFVGLYPISKMLRFELKPIGKTRNYISERGLLKIDEDRSESYKKMKKSLDEYHKAFIDDSLAKASLTSLDLYLELYNSCRKSKIGNDGSIKKLVALKESMRKEIVQYFKDNGVSDLLKNSKAINSMEQWSSERELYYDEDFKNFSTYFAGFNENRKNIYTREDKSTSIAHRIVHVNLPKFIDNIEVFAKVKNSGVIEKFLEESGGHYKDVLEDPVLDDVFALPYYNSVLTQKGIDLYNHLIGGFAKSDGTKIQGLNEYINRYNQEKEKDERIPKFDNLYKQVLSDRVEMSFLPEKFGSDKEMLNTINSFYLNNLRSCNIGNSEDIDVIKAIQSIAKELSQYDSSGIYLRNNTQLTRISKRIFGDYGFIGTAMDNYYRSVVYPNYDNECVKSTEKKLENLGKAKKRFTGADYLSIATIQSAIDLYVEKLDEKPTNSSILNYFADVKGVDTETNEDYDTIIASNYKEIETEINNVISDGEFNKKESLPKIKKFLDYIYCCPIKK